MLFFVRLVFKNLFRHRLRSILTLVGIIIAMTAFVLLRTVVDSWYAGAEATSAKRLVTRNAISLVFPLPLSYRNRIRGIEGIEAVSHATWFGAVYINEKNFFPQFAVDPGSYLPLYPEFSLSPDEKSAFLRDRQGAVAGRKLAREYGWKIGDLIPLKGTIYPGNWAFVLRGIYRGAEEKTDETQFFFHWDYLNETLKKRGAANADRVGIYISELARADEAAEVSRRIDRSFSNSLAETLTETEKAFQLGFVSMTEAIVTAIEIVSVVVIGIIMAVMANTMAMTARERRREYATLKALGFGPGYIFALIFGESLMLSSAGGVIGVLLGYPAADIFADRVGALIPVIRVADLTVAMALAASLVVGLSAAVFPAWRAVRDSVSAGLGRVG